MRKNLKNIIIGIAMVSALCFTACSSGEKKEEAVATESVETTEEAVETTKESLETKKSSAETTEVKNDNIEANSFILGQLDGEVYTNKMFNIKFDADANGMRLLSDLELLQLGNSTSDRNDSAAVNASLDSGDIFMDMYSKNEDDSRRTNVVVEKISKKGIKNAKDYADKSIPLLKNEFEKLGFTEINLERKEEKFMGEDISSITISFSANGNTQYQKQVVMIKGDYAGIITIAGKDEAEVQSLLENFSKAE